MEEIVIHSKTLGEFFVSMCALYRERTALEFFHDKRLATLTYGRLLETARSAAAGLRRAGFIPGQRAFLWGKSSPEWIIALIAVHICGGVDVSIDEDIHSNRVKSLLSRTGCSFCFVDEQLDLDLGEMPVHKIMLSWKYHRNTMSLADLTGFKNGRIKPDWKRANPFHTRLKDDPASLFFRRDALTSENPRCVVLKHSGILSNIENLAPIIPATELDRLLCAIPIWHSAGRCWLYFAFHQGCTFIISQAPTYQTDLAFFRPTLAALSPQEVHEFHRKSMEGWRNVSTWAGLLRRPFFFLGRRYNRAVSFMRGQLPIFGRYESWVDVTSFFFALFSLIFLTPVQWTIEAFIASGLRRRLGGRLRAILTGGGKIQPFAEHFYQTIGVPLLEGYWMTEASHLLASRSLEYTGQRNRIVHGTVGPMIPGTELKLIAPNGQDVTNRPGALGQIFVRGDQIMQGYFEEPSATRQVLDENGWLKTGDRGRLTVTGELQII